MKMRFLGDILCVHRKRNLDHHLFPQRRTAFINRSIFAANFFVNCVTTLVGRRVVRGCWPPFFVTHWKRDDVLATINEFPLTLTSPFRLRTVYQKTVIHKRLLWDI